MQVLKTREPMIHYLAGAIGVCLVFGSVRSSLVFGVAMVLSEEDVYILRGLRSTKEISTY